MLVMMLLASVSFTSCLNDDKDDDNEEQEVTPLASGLCGVSWHLCDIEGSTNDTVIDQNDSYTFDLMGNGSHSYTNSETGEVETMLFTWKAYTYSGATYRLALKYQEYGDTEFYTIYTIGSDGILCLLIGSDTNDGTNRVAYYEPR